MIMIAFLAAMIFSFLSLDAGAQEPATEVGALSASLRPGQWREFQATGYDFTTLMRGDNILAYAGRAAWDDVSQQALFIGQVHLKGPPVFIAYAAQTNSWRRMPTPPWAEALKWFHAYENNAADSARGMFFHHSSASQLVHRYDVASNAWTTLPEIAAPTGHGTALEYFPEMQGLVRVLNGEVWFWSEKQNAWSQIADKLDMGPYHNFANYSAKFKMVLLGGGNNSQAIHRLDSQGKFATGKAAPVDLGIGRSLNVVDPVSGELLVLSRQKRFLAYDPGKDEWRELPALDGPVAMYDGHSVSAAPLPPWGVVLFFSSQPQGMKTYLYKHAPR